MPSTVGRSFLSTLYAKIIGLCVRVLRKRGLMAAAVSGEGAEGGANFSPAYVVCMRDDKFRQLAGIDADAYREEVRAAEEEKIPTLGPLTDGRRRDGEGTGAR